MAQCSVFRLKPAGWLDSSDNRSARSGPVAANLVDPYGHISEIKMKTRELPLTTHSGHCRYPGVVVRRAQSHGILLGE